ncbi:MAG: ankyrin repeat domain-containing protein [Gaiellaceae bacterium]
MNLEQLRKQAKELVRAARAGDASALARLGELKPILASAQLVLAREHGHPSWPALVHALEANVESFVVAATEAKRPRAEALLAARPDVERDPWVRLVLGRGWDGDPNLASGPRGWSPLHYVCHSAFASVALARELLERGADPNAFYPNEYGPMSVLYGAAGVLHHPELTELLLRSGADPNAEPQRGDALYHACEAESMECLRLLLDHGAEPNGTNALAHALDYDHLEHVRLLLGAGADPNEGALLAHAVRRGRGPEFVRLLAEREADLDALGGETWRGDVPLRTAYQHALLRGRSDVAETLAALGASTDVAPCDLAIAAVARGERPEGGLSADLDPDAQEVLILAALEDRVDLVLALVGVDFVGVVGGSPAGTLLHHAAWVGGAEVVEKLLAAGADPSASSFATYSTPLGFAALGSQHHALPGRDYVAVAELLTSAGAEVEPRFLEVAEGELTAWLEERLG